MFEQADVLDIRLSAIGGLIFGKDDNPYRGILLPGAFWKLIAYRGANDNGLRCATFLLSQDELLSDLERLDPDPFRIYQIDLAELAQRTAHIARLLGPERDRCPGSSRDRHTTCSKRDCQIASGVHFRNPFAR